jgi:hypothetical protein
LLNLFFLAKEVPLKKPTLNQLPLLLAMKLTSASFVAASMRLFKSVLEAKEPMDNAVVLKNYGLVIAPSASHYEREIRSYLKSEKLTGVQMNQTFYSSAAEVEGKSIEERIADQLTHYFTTYGLRMLGVNTDFMYIPHNWKELNLPERVKFDVVTGVSADVLTSACFDLLASGVAMKQETIEDVLIVLEGCDYEFTGSELIKNKEARMFIYDKLSITPTNSEDLFRFIVFKAIGQTALVKDKKTLEALKYSGYELPSLTEDQLKGLARSFNRRKEYWMALKSVADYNRAVVNKISRYSKSLHEPLKQDILNNLTALVSAGQVDVEKLKASLSGVPIFRVVRAINALKIQFASPEYKLYAIRNGKIYVKPGQAFKKSEKALTSLKAYMILTEHLEQAVDKEKKVYVPSGVQYAFPTSEKQFVGEVPNFSTVEVDYSERDLLIGVYWENGSHAYVDYDLSCGSIDGDRVGWNSRWVDGDLTFSGDITNAPNGAAEWMVVKNLSSSWQIVNNLFNGGYHNNTFPEFHIMVGYGRKKKQRGGERGDYRNYFIKPDDLLFSAKVQPTKRQTVIGVVSPAGENMARFTLLNSGNGGRSVASGGQAVSLISATLPRAENTLKINDFLNICSDPSEADIDLSPSKLTKDSLLSLLK